MGSGKLSEKQLRQLENLRKENETRAYWEEQARKDYEEHVRLRDNDGHGLKAGDIVKCKDGVEYCIYGVESCCGHNSFYNYIPGVTKYRIDWVREDGKGLFKMQSRYIKWITQEEYDKILSNDYYHNSPEGYRWRIYNENNEEVAYCKGAYIALQKLRQLEKGELDIPPADPKINMEIYNTWCYFECKLWVYALIIPCILISILIKGGFTIWVAYIGLWIYGMYMTKRVDKWMLREMEMMKITSWWNPEPKVK